MSLKLIECPRDAMQGIAEFIPTEVKIDYINTLLNCGFDTIDFGSFVSPKAIPQLRDTEQVLAGLQESKTKLLAIVANERGAEQASKFDRIDYLGYPFSISEEFQKRNTNASITESLSRVEEIQKICQKSNKRLVVYLSMGFGNPYGEKWSVEVLYKWCNTLYKELNIQIMALSDTIGCATETIVYEVFKEMTPELPHVELGAHLHTRQDKAQSILEAAYKGGCRRFDSAVKGYGGCPMATDRLTGNMPTELVLDWFLKNNIPTDIQQDTFEVAMQKSVTVFPIH